MRAQDDFAHLLALAACPADDLSVGVMQTARLSLFDTLVVARAGANEPVAKIVRDLVEDDGGRPLAQVVGGGRVPARAAALANGTIAHALDYDDTHFGHVGHVSVAVLPAALAVGEAVGARAGDVLAAFAVGAEAACRVGLMLGRPHYLAGFHQTGTSGAFGATVAAGRLFGLDAAAWRNALSLVSTRASGLKSQFGTMGKPFNAGIAAANGVEAAALAMRGFVSADDGLTGPQGFIETHSGAFDPAAWQTPPPGRFLFEDNKYKLHACCHGLHAMIEALLKVRSRLGDPSAVHAIEIATNPRWLHVCDIKTPRTGLELKFSYAYLAAMVLAGVPTGADHAYTEAACHDPDLTRTAKKVTVRADEGESDTSTTVVLTLADGQTITTRHDLAAPMDAAALTSGLRAKAAGLLGEPAADRLWQGTRNAAEGGASSAADLAALIAP